MKVTPTPYQPSNHTAGEMFFQQWCHHCACDKSMSEDVPLDECADDEKCDIIARSMAFNINDAEYPREWIYSALGPCCTAFIPAGEEIKHRCERTVDMFDARS